jgi:hypothetical protein
MVQMGIVPEGNMSNLHIHFFATPLKKQETKITNPSTSSCDLKINIQSSPIPKRSQTLRLSPVSFDSDTSACSYQRTRPGQGSWQSLRDTMSSDAIVFTSISRQWTTPGRRRPDSYLGSASMPDKKGNLVIVTGDFTSSRADTPASRYAGSLPCL